MTSARRAKKTDATEFRIFINLQRLGFDNVHRKLGPIGGWTNRSMTDFVSGRPENSTIPCSNRSEGIVVLQAVCYWMQHLGFLL